MVLGKPRRGWHSHVIAFSFLWIIFLRGRERDVFPGMVWLGQGILTFLLFFVFLVKLFSKWFFSLICTLFVHVIFSFIFGISKYVFHQFVKYPYVIVVGRILRYCSKFPILPPPIYLLEVIPQTANVMDFTPIITLYYMAQLTLRRRLSEWVWSYIVVMTTLALWKYSFLWLVVKEEVRKIKNMRKNHHPLLAWRLRRPCRKELDLKLSSS